MLHRHFLLEILRVTQERIPASAVGEWGEEVREERSLCQQLEVQFCLELSELTSEIYY